MNNAHFSAYSSLFYPRSWSFLKIEMFFKDLAYWPALLFRLFCIVFSVMYLSQAAFATNLDAEEQIGRALIKSIDADQIIWLETSSSRKTLALFKPAEGVDLLGSIIILADLNNHPDWPQVISPLRNKLPSFGWETLSIQTPQTPQNGLTPELSNIFEISVARIKAGVKFFKSKNRTNIVIIGHRLSAGIAIKFIIENQEDIDDIVALVGISSFDTPWINSSQLMRQLPIAFLDIFAQHDATAVLKAAPKRLVSAKFSGQLIKKSATTSLSPKVTQLAINKTGNAHYRQMNVNGANQYFSIHQGVLLKTIRGWLKSHESKQTKQL